MNGLERILVELFLGKMVILLYNRDNILGAEELHLEVCQVADIIFYLLWRVRW